MAEVVLKEHCRCVNCGNEAEMMFTCSLPEPDSAPDRSPSAGSKPQPQKVKATGTCVHCGNEAEMWIDL
jgi:hypothetical protein